MKGPPALPAWVFHGNWGMRYYASKIPFQGLGTEIEIVYISNILSGGSRASLSGLNQGHPDCGS